MKRADLEAHQGHPPLPPGVYGRDPSRSRSTRAALHISMDKVKRTSCKIMQEPVSLATPIGEDEDSYLEGISSRIRPVPAPVDFRDVSFLRRGEVEKVLSDADPTARPRSSSCASASSPATRARWEEARPHFPGHARARPADRSQGHPQAAPPVAEQVAPGLHGLGAKWPTTGIPTSEGLVYGLALLLALFVAYSGLRRAFLAADSRALAGALPPGFPRRARRGSLSPRRRKGASRSFPRSRRSSRAPCAPAASRRPRQPPLSKPSSQRGQGPMPRPA